jgi:putative endonuclease
LSKRRRYFVYVLGSTGKRRALTYVGWTMDLNQRLGAHNTGNGAKFTRGRVWTLLYAERHRSQRAAMSREWYLKRDRAFRARLREALR